MWKSKVKILGKKEEPKATPQGEPHKQDRELYSLILQFDKLQAHKV